MTRWARCPGWLAVIALTGAEAQITFVKDEKGKVIKGIHRQGGRTFEAPKIE